MDEWDSDVEMWAVRLRCRVMASWGTTAGLEGYFSCSRLIGCVFLLAPLKPSRFKSSCKHTSWWNVSEPVSAGESLPVHLGTRGGNTSEACRVIFGRRCRGNNLSAVSQQEESGCCREIHAHRLETNRLACWLHRASAQVMCECRLVCGKFFPAAGRNWPFAANTDDVFMETDASNSYWHLILT